MKKLNLRVRAGLAGMLSLTAVCGYVTAFAADSGFSDIEGHWAEATIIKWKDEGIISGYTDGTFKPDKYVTRAELAKILTKAFDLKEEFDLSIDFKEEEKIPEDYKYDDVDSSSWYYPYLKCSARYMPIYPLPVGYTANLPFVDNDERRGYRFLPDIEEIRMHFAESMVKIKMERENLNIEIPSFAEVSDSVAKFFKDAEYQYPLTDPRGHTPTNVKRMFDYTWLAKELDVMNGDINGEFLPYNNVSRAEVLTVIDRMLTES